MKPDWKDAPDWAHCLAQDGDGEWFWYEEEPVWCNQTVQWNPERDTQTAWAGTGSTCGYIEVRQ